MAHGWDNGSGGHGSFYRDGREKGEAGKPVMESRTIGWRPTCRCKGGHAKTVPCILPDPFGGSGTTARVALELNRRPIILDLAYQDLQKKCLTNVQPQLLMA